MMAGTPGLRFHGNELQVGRSRPRNAVTATTVILREGGGFMVVGARASPSTACARGCPFLYSRGRPGAPGMGPPIKSEDDEGGRRTRGFAWTGGLAHGGLTGSDTRREPGTRMPGMGPVPSLERAGVRGCGCGQGAGKAADRVLATPSLPPPSSSAKAEDDGGGARASPSKRARARGCPVLYSRVVQGHRDRSSDQVGG